MNTRHILDFMEATIAAIQQVAKEQSGDNYHMSLVWLKLQCMKDSFEAFKIYIETQNNIEYLKEALN